MTYYIKIFSIVVLINLLLVSCTNNFMEVENKALEIEESKNLDVEDNNMIVVDDVIKEKASEIEQETGTFEKFDIKYVLVFDNFTGDEHMKIDLNEPVTERWPYHNLQSFSLEQLSILRNAYFAKYGYVFQNNKYNEFFCNQTWYVPDESIEDINSMLNDLDWFRVNIIQNYEQYLNTIGITEIVLEYYGLIIPFPSRWDDRYKIKYEDNYILVSYVSEMDEDYYGLFFILTRDLDEYTKHFPLICNLEINNIQYKVLGPSGIEIPHNPLEFNIYCDMLLGLEEVLYSIRPIDS